MDYDIKFCPDCKKEVEVSWSFGRERCRECKKALDKEPIDHKVYVPLGTTELNRRQVINMKNLGIF
jgi:predicted amidophosphoribosyltransferase